MKDLDDFTIAIVGLGLMGGSLAMALKQQRVGRCVQGADADPQVVARALALGVIDAPCADVTQVDWVVLAMPVRGIVAWLQARGCALSAEQIVMDIGSTKQQVVAAMEPLTAQCIGGHPMCGKETAGLASADAQLFRGARFVLTPTTRTHDATLRSTQSLVRRIGAQPIVMDAEAHDRATAAISHLPYLLSVNLVNTVAAQHNADAMPLAASGYASATRLAASDTRMMGDIIATNRAHVLHILDAYQAELARLREAIADGDEEQWRERLAYAKKVKSVE